jgi:hypothetical protein
MQLFRVISADIDLRAAPITMYDTNSRSAPTAAVGLAQRGLRISGWIQIAAVQGSCIESACTAR